LSTSSFFVAQVLIHLVTGTIAVVLNIGIGTSKESTIHDPCVPDDNLKKSGTDEMNVNYAGVTSVRGEPVKDILRQDLAGKAPC